MAGTFDRTGPPRKALKNGDYASPPAQWRDRRSCEPLARAAPISAAGVETDWDVPDKRSPGKSVTFRGSEVVGVTGIEPVTPTMSR
jgi:hypothetical protein